MSILRRWSTFRREGPVHGSDQTQSSCHLEIVPCLRRDTRQNRGHRTNSRPGQHSYSPGLVVQGPRDSVRCQLGASQRRRSQKNSSCSIQPLDTCLLPGMMQHRATGSSSLTHPIWGVLARPLLTACAAFRTDSKAKDFPIFLCIDIVAGNGIGQRTESANQFTPFAKQALDQMRRQYRCRLVWSVLCARTVGGPFGPSSFIKYSPQAPSVNCPQSRNFSSTCTRIASGHPVANQS